ncbi:hypothetical protein [Marinobacter salarius]|uniref:hypothetical protein n=1 Tax=Marinobacter salarius TaxID=1420917 RepID=UPI003D142E19
MNQQPKRNPQCNCINCDRSCFRGKSGTTHRRTNKAAALNRLEALKAWIAGEGEKPCL